jgi:hypothetical protein
MWLTGVHLFQWQASENEHEKSLPLVVAIILTVMAGLGHAADLIVIKFSHVVANDTPKGKGAVKVEVYPNSAPCKDKEDRGIATGCGADTRAVARQVRAR